MSQSNCTKPPITKSEWSTSLLAVVAAFGAYFCVYGFRKTFIVGSYDSVGVEGYKAILVASQTIGYALSKFIGIKVVSEVTPGQRVRMLLGVVGIAGLALLFFGLTPAPYNLVWLFVNGLAYVAISLTGILVPRLQGSVFRISMPVLFGEVALTLWLIVVGAREPLAVAADCSQLA